MQARVLTVADLETIQSPDGRFFAALYSFYVAE
jgi:hypothetical protein